MKLKISTIFLLAAFVSVGLLGFYSISDNEPNDVANQFEQSTNDINLYNSTLDPNFYGQNDNPAILHDQSELVSNPGAGFGGADASAITTPGTLFGASTTGNPFKMSDDFTVPPGQSWQIDSIIVFGYQTGSTTTSTMTEARLEIQSGIGPDTTGSTVVFGDTTTNRMLGSYFSGIYRVTGTTLTNNQRPIMRINVTVNSTLPSGNYWLISSLKGSLASGPWSPPRTIPAVPLTGNGKQRVATGWQPYVDGTPPSGQGVPFVIYGSVVGGGSTSLCFNRSGLNLAIPDNNIATGVRDTINVSNNGGNIDDITVVIGDIQHTWIGDMITELSHSGQTDTLFSRIGTGGFGNSSDNMLNVRFTDSATVPINTLDNTTSPSGGTFLPGGRTGVDSLRKHFKNQNIAGPWVLWIRDAAAGDLGTLQAWSICFYGASFTQIISNNNQTPDRYSLEQNYPNPFNPTTKIKFALPKAGLVSLKVYDMLGREVQTLINQQLNAGEFIADFDGANLSSGTYFYRLQVGDFVQIKKMVLLK